MVEIQGMFVDVPIEWMFVFLADELMFIFGEPLNIADDLLYTHDEMLISEKMMSYWTNFAKYR